MTNSGRPKERKKVYSHIIQTAKGAGAKDFVRQLNTNINYLDLVNDKGG